MAKHGPSGASFPGVDAYWQGGFNEGNFNYKMVFQASVQPNMSGIWVIDVQNYLTPQSSNNWPLHGAAIEKCTYCYFYIQIEYNTQTWYLASYPGVYNELNDNQGSPVSNNTKSDLFIDADNYQSIGNPYYFPWDGNFGYPITAIRITGYMWCYGPNNGGNYPMYVYIAPGDVTSGNGNANQGTLNYYYYIDYNTHTIN